MSITSVGSSASWRNVCAPVVAGSVEDQIAAMRELLASDDPNRQVTMAGDGTIINPGEGSAGSGSSVDMNQPISVVNAPVVAGSVEDQIAAMRELLASDDPNRQVTMAGDGTIINPGEGSAGSGSSVDMNQPISVVNAPVVAAQWYETNPGLQRSEIEAMRAFHPAAKMGYLPDGRMYWMITVTPEVLNERKEWSFLAVYDEDHPQKRWGGSVKFYPVKPNFAEMKERVERSPVTPKSIPHVLRDSDHQVYVCSQHMDMIQAGRKKGGKVTSAAGCLRNVIYWVNMFEWGLHDQAIWDEFHKHRQAHQ